ncbi:MAG: heparinase II/III family protein [Bacteroidales bacterium]|nr:heparinase II/III family protein [Bacteroidales bacterium]
MKRISALICFAVLFLAAACSGGKQQGQMHPSLALTPAGVKQIRSGVNKAPLFQAAVRDLYAKADEALQRPVEVPVPKDGGGGYTHETHKRNYYDMYYMGLAWQISGNRAYADKVRDILLEYAKLYPTLGYHPMTLSPVRGKLFWQTLNESVWLVHSAMAYDCVYDAIPAETRSVIEENLLRPVARFIMEGTPDNRANFETFNKMHNHGTWAQAAVGMAGFAMGDEDLVRKALYGSREGGGFIRQLDCLFSPDGYFTEGAYYHRYAIWPFVLFAQAIEHNMPELGIFEYRDGIITRSVGTLLNMAYEGEFFHINDAMEKGYDAQELVCAVDIAYAARPQDRFLLDVVQRYQGTVSVSDAGFKVARDIAAGLAEPLKLSSALYRDGAEGKDGGFAVLRGRGGSTLTFKATSHGLSHGHYDKLTIAYYDSGHEVLSDYGAARFHNIEAKYKGHYTPENKSYAMTSIAHNTLVADETSHFGGKIKESSKHSPRILAYSDEDPAFQYVAALDSCAYPGIRMSRWVALAELPFLQGPFVIDVLKAESDKPHTYDYPLHYNGHMVSLSVPYTRAVETMKAFGTAPGYRHLWLEAEAAGAEGSTSYTWLCGNKLYSFTGLSTPASEVKLLRSGAGDPDFNLRSEPCLLLREKNLRSRTFAGCLESHGNYDPRVYETASDMERSCIGIELGKDDAEGISLLYSFKGGERLEVCINLINNSMTIKY